MSFKVLIPSNIQALFSDNIVSKLTVTEQKKDYEIVKFHMSFHGKVYEEEHLLDIVSALLESIPPSWIHQIKEKQNIETFRERFLFAFEKQIPDTYFVLNFKGGNYRKKVIFSSLFWSAGFNGFVYFGDGLDSFSSDRLSTVFEIKEFNSLVDSLLRSYKFESFEEISYDEDSDPFDIVFENVFYSDNILYTKGIQSVGYLTFQESEDWKKENPTFKLESLGAPRWRLKNS
jgi:hypothetical protein